jgi:hypothetical protein
LLNELAGQRRTLGRAYRLGFARSGFNSFLVDLGGMAQAGLCCGVSVEAGRFGFRGFQLAL